MDKELCATQISELNKMHKLAKYLIRENVEKDPAWESGLMDLLCEYYMHTKQMMK